MLFCLQFSGLISLYDPLRNYGFPAVLAYIGYDPTTDHTGDTFNPIDDPDFDWLYTEQFRLNMSVYQSSGSTSTGVIFGGTDNAVSVSGQRKFGGNVVPFFGIRQVYAPPAQELWDTFVQAYVRVLIETNGL
jgi:hypothetical protein